MIVSPADFADGYWHTLCFSYNSNIVTVYIDGVHYPTSWPVFYRKTQERSDRQQREKIERKREQEKQIANEFERQISFFINGNYKINAKL